MDDIVERLRNACAYGRRNICDECGRENAYAVAQVAADIIMMQADEIRSLHGLLKDFESQIETEEAEIERLQEVITDFVEAREALNKNEWCDDSGAFASAYQDASRALEREARRG